jgi:archaellum component FlaC
MRTREEIDKEYADLCTKYGHTSQEINFVERQASLIKAKLEEQIEEAKAASEGAVVTLNAELRRIAQRWVELREELEAQSTVPNS